LLTVVLDLKSDLVVELRYEMGVQRELSRSTK
jgi:hypothetical protein